MALVKANLQELNPDSSNKGVPLEVQFNPQSLRVNYRTSGSPGTQVPGGTTPKQGTSAMNTGSNASLSLELLFDTSDSGKDVRTTTLQIAEWIVPRQVRESKDQPRIRFQWGTFLFIGYLQSMDETLDLFSEDGKPLRATVSLSMNENAFEQRQAAGAGGGAGAGFGAGISAGFSAGISAGVGFSAGASVGTTPLTLSQAGDTLQDMSARAGVDWKAVATANGIDNPRRIAPGTILDLNASASVNVGLS
jgi:hypothetical protein